MFLWVSGLACETYTKKFTLDMTVVGEDRGSGNPMLTSVDSYLTRCSSGSGRRKERTVHR